MNRQNDAGQVAHLLRRFGLGASEAEVDFYGRDGYLGAVDRLLGYEDADSGVEVDPMAFAARNGAVNFRVMQALWYMRLVGTRRPLEERLTVFWHHHFATSGQKVDNPFVMDAHVRTLREHATGKFPRLLEAVSKDPAMLYWLDNQENVAGSPNENFAREVMELFTLGIGHYSEEDVKEAARAFTGWTYGPGGRVPRRSASDPPRRADRFLFWARSHDAGRKTVLGESDRLGGDDVLRILCSKRQTALHLVSKIWDWFVYPNPEATLVDRLAGQFIDSGLDVSVLLRAIMTSSEFLSEKAVRAVVKNPVDFTVSTVRQLGLGERLMESVRAAEKEPERDDNGVNRALLRTLPPVVAVANACEAMGMDLMFPADVNGWKNGSAWITSSTVIERSKWADRLFGVSQASPRLQGGARPAMAGVQTYPLFESDPTPKGAVRAILSLFDAQPKPEDVPILEQAAEAAAQGATGGAITPQTANGVARSVARLVFASPEFQFA
jgi:uncharacterized protein (DUF1800 family)